jgi:hypothetical protein
VYADELDLARRMRSVALLLDRESMFGGIVRACGRSRPRCRVGMCLLTRPVRSGRGCNFGRYCCPVGKVPAGYGRRRSHLACNVKIAIWEGVEKESASTVPETIHVPDLYLTCWWQSHRSFCFACMPTGKQTPLPLYTCRRSYIPLRRRQPDIASCSTETLPSIL